MSGETESLKKQLPEAQITEVVEAVGRALKGEDGMALTRLDVDDDTLRTALEDAVRDALDISPVKALLKGWKGVAEVRKLTGEDGEMDGKTRKVALASHSLTAAHTPEIHIELGKVATLKKIPVPVAFTLKIEGLILAITNRQIREIAGGKAQPEVTIKVEGVTIIKEKLKAINLPVNVSLYEDPQTDPTPEPA